jgi:tRNA(adenine34) deaminase
MLSDAVARDEEFMRRALELAREAAAEGEVPVGAVIVRGDSIMSCGRNRRELGKNALHHAELEAIDGACRALGGWRLWECELFVTLEPCPMCAGAVINARIPRIVFGASDPKAGSCGSVVNLFALPYNHRPEVVGGVLEEECAALLRDFFRSLRAKKMPEGRKSGSGAE